VKKNRALLGGPVGTCSFLERTLSVGLNFVLTLNKLREDPIFYRRVVVRNALSVKPSSLEEENFQRRFSVNVWCGLFGRY
jgi:hypothetical protein